MGQHYVPEVYLKEFSHAQGMFFVLNIKDAVRFEKYHVQAKAYRSYCQEKDFYTIDTDSIKIFGLDEDVNPLKIENEINGAFERDYNIYLKKFISGSSFTNSQAQQLIKMIVHFKLRNKYWRNSFNSDRIIKILEVNLNEYIDKAINNADLFPNMPVDLKLHVINQIHEKYKKTDQLEKLFQLWSMIKRSKEDSDLTTKYTQILLNSRWILLISDNTNEFVTTDNPGFSIDQSGKLHNTKFVDKAKFYFPLTPHYCLIIDTGQIDIKFYNNPEEKILDMQLANFAVTAIANHNSCLIAPSYAFAASRSVLDTLKTNCLPNR